MTSLEASKHTTNDARVGDPRHGVPTGDLRVRRGKLLFWLTFDISRGINPDGDQHYNNNQHSDPLYYRTCTCMRARALFIEWC